MARVLFYGVYFLSVLIAQTFGSGQVSSSSPPSSCSSPSSSSSPPSSSSTTSETIPEITSASLSGYKWTSPEHVSGDDSWESFHTQETSTPSFESVSLSTQTTITTAAPAKTENNTPLAIDSIIISALFLCALLIIIFQRHLRNLCLHFEWFRKIDAACRKRRKENNGTELEDVTLEWNSNASSSDTDTSVTDES